MIQFKNITKETPYLILKKYYDDAIHAGQEHIESIAISSYSKENNEVDSRFVNLKFIIKNEFIFFSNYNSPKSSSFKSSNQMSALFFWSKINLQIRMRANISKTNVIFNKQYFKNRSVDKNAVAISSDQSKKIDSYEQVISNYKQVKERNDLTICPEYWGGFSFIPYSFEFWKGHESRINERNFYEKINDEWIHSILQP